MNKITVHIDSEIYLTDGHGVGGGRRMQDRISHEIKDQIFSYIYCILKAMSYFW